VRSAGARPRVERLVRLLLLSLRFFRRLDRQADRIFLARSPSPKVTENKQCYSCGGMGHVVAECPSIRVGYVPTPRPRSCSARLTLLPLQRLQLGRPEVLQLPAVRPPRSLVPEPVDRCRRRPGRRGRRRRRRLDRARPGRRDRPACRRYPSRGPDGGSRRRLCAARRVHGRPRWLHGRSSRYVSLVSPRASRACRRTRADPKLSLAGRCYGCGGHGHQARNCPTAANFGAVNFGVPRPPKTCYKVRTVLSSSSCF